MKKARLIKKTELAEQVPPRQQPSSTTNHALTHLTQKTVTQWMEARQQVRRQNPHAAFAALFAAKA
jgi:hypothetical protein